MPSRGLSLPTPSKSKTCSGVRRCASRFRNGVVSSLRKRHRRALTRLPQQCARLLTAELLSRRPAIGGVVAHLNQTVLPYEKMHVWPATSAEVTACQILDYHTHKRTNPQRRTHGRTFFFLEKESSLPDRSENKAARPRPFLHPPPLVPLPAAVLAGLLAPPSPPHPHHLGHGTHVNQALNPERTCRVPSRPTV